MQLPHIELMFSDVLPNYRVGDEEPTDYNFHDVIRKVSQSDQLIELPCEILENGYIEDLKSNQVWQPCLCLLAAIGCIVITQHGQGPIQKFFPISDLEIRVENSSNIFALIHGGKKE